MFPAATASASIPRNTAEGVVPPYYDSLIAKLIVHGVDREEAIAKMERALKQFIVQGIDTSISAPPGDLRRRRFPRGQLRHQVYGALPRQAQCVDHKWVLPLVSIFET